MAYLDMLERQKRAQEETHQWEQHTKETEEPVQKEVVSMNAIHERHLRVARKRVVADRDPKKKLSRSDRVQE